MEPDPPVHELVVFEKTICPRCTFSTSYLMDNNADFKIVDITEKESECNVLMWKIIREQYGDLKKGITTPAILVDGKLTHSHKDLKGFLDALLE